MYGLIFGLLSIAIVLQISEVLWKKNILRDESARKFVHILSGCFIASWPWYLTWNQIRLLGLGLLAGVLINQRYHIFHAINGVKRNTFGDKAYALGIIVTSLITTNKYFFAVAVLHLALADGVAALVGKRVHKKWNYNILGNTKTVIGSMVFWVASLCICGVVLMLADNFDYKNYLMALLLVPPLATLAENLSPKGFDNVMVPIVVAFSLLAIY